MTLWGFTVLAEHDHDELPLGHCPKHGTFVKTSAWPAGLCKECHVGKKYAVYESEMDFIREVMTTRGV